MIEKVEEGSTKMKVEDEREVRGGFPAARAGIHFYAFGFLQCPNKKTGDLAETPGAQRRACSKRHHPDLFPAIPAALREKSDSCFRDDAFSCGDAVLSSFIVLYLGPSGGKSR